MDAGKVNKKNALLSVFNKTGIVDFARELVGMGWTLYSSGGTARTISEAGVPVTDVATLVGGGAILGHRVVTLSREVHAGLLATDTPEDLAELERLGVPWLDLVCVDMYPLHAEIMNPKSTRESVIDKTDIGGPTMLRSAAKGRRTVMCDPDDRVSVIEWLCMGEPDRENFITALVAKAEKTVAEYCLTSAMYHDPGQYAGIIGKQALLCKYGENAYQTPAGLYSSCTHDPLAIDKFLPPIAGTAPSYNNICDLDRLLQTMTHIAATFQRNYGFVPAVALAAKHGNMCGAAIGDEEDVVLEKMLGGDPLAIFGGLVMLNFPVTEAIADKLLNWQMEEGKKRLFDGIIAPHFDEGVIEQLQRRGDKCRLMANPELASLNHESLDTAPRLRYVRGGLLFQPNYTFIFDMDDSQVTKIGRASRNQERDLALAKAICDTSNSNTVTLVKDGMLIGNGVGQHARVYGARLAIDRAKSCGHEISGACAASDSFFPFTDGVEALVEAGVAAIISTSGSVGDKAVVEYCTEKDVPLYLIPDSIGRGFFGH